jgi:hypothetical protein
MSTDISEEHIASIFRVEKISSARNSKQAGGKHSIYLETKIAFRVYEHLRLKTDVPHIYNFQ